MVGKEREKLSNVYWPLSEGQTERLLLASSMS